MTSIRTKEVSFEDFAKIVKEADGNPEKVIAALEKLKGESNTHKEEDILGKAAEVAAEKLSPEKEEVAVRSCALDIFKSMQYSEFLMIKRMYTPGNLGPATKQFAEKCLQRATEYFEDWIAGGGQEMSFSKFRELMRK